MKKNWDRIVEAERLAAQGLRQSEIARRLDVAPSTISKWLHPARAKEYNRRSNAQPGRSEVKLAWSRAARSDPTNLKPCSSCGGPTGSFIWAGEQSDVCWSCLLKRREARWRLIAIWWSQGLTYRQIGERLGWTPAAAGMEVHRMREAGWNLPGRRPGRRAAA